jgi:hypothetical protein
MKEEIMKKDKNSTTMKYIRLECVRIAGDILRNEGIKPTVETVLEKSKQIFKWVNR